MSHVRSFVKFWLPVILWLALIFFASGDELSSQHTSRFLGPLIHWFFPSLPPDTLETIVYYIRKTGHVTEYGVLALLFWRALRKPIKHDQRPWSWSLARLVLLLAALYAASDEFHQSFVPSREARLHDVVIDTCGATAALLLLWLAGRRLKCWRA